MGKRELVDLSEQVWLRIQSRLGGLTDDEYFWEPAPGCWTVHQRDDGSWVADSSLPRPEPEPFTTIAWRLWHLIDMYGEDRAPRWLGVAAQGSPIGLDDPTGSPPPTAADSLALLERAHDRWDAHLALVSDELLAEPVGLVGGPVYAERTKAAYVLHMLDEFIHHGAEIALLRDLWRWQRPIATDERMDLIARGDVRALDGLSDSDLTAEFVDQAAAYGRWALVVELVRRGAPVATAGRTPLHVAAGAGELGVVQTLLDHGADPTVTDPEFRATPRQWAEFLSRPQVVELLDRAGNDKATG